MNTVVTSIRLPEDIFDKIKKLAEEDKRSITKEIEYILVKYFDMIDRN